MDIIRNRAIEALAEYYSDEHSDLYPFWDDQGEWSDDQRNECYQVAIEQLAALEEAGLTITANTEPAYIQMTIEFIRMLANTIEKGDRSPVIVAALRETADRAFLREGPPK